jgi:DNA uptake protein ComE-like DNA-binding protein
VPEGTISLATADFEDLRDLGLSVTQAKRVIRYRDERGLTSPDELDGVPGFPRTFLDDLKAKLIP